MLAFVAEIVSQFPVTRDLTHVGLVKFSTNAMVEFRLDRHYSNAEINRTIYGVQHTGGETNIAEGLRLMRTQVFTRDGDRNNAKNIAIVITDGVANYEANRVEEEARRARQDQNIEIFTVGITNQIDESELELIASEPYSDHKFLSPNFLDLRNILTEVKRRACEVSPTIGPTPYPTPPIRTREPVTPRPTRRPTTPYSTPRPTRNPPVTTPTRPVVIPGEFSSSTRGLWYGFLS